MNLSSEQINKYLAIIKEKPEIDVMIEIIHSCPEVTSLMIDLMKQDKGSIKFYAEKVIRKISETSPLLVYPFFHDIASFLDSPNHFIQWGTIQTIAT